MRPEIDYRDELTPNMNFENLTTEELIQHVWASAAERTPLELHLAMAVAQLLDEYEGGDGDDT